MVIVFTIQMLLGKTNKRSSGVRALVGHIVALSQLFVYFCFVTIATIASRIVQYLPFLVFVFLLSTIYDNYGEGLLALMDSYNTYVTNTEFFDGIRLAQDFGRVVFEVITPVANFVVDFFRIVPVEILRLLLSPSLLGNITQLLSAVTALIIDIVLALANFIARERGECTNAAVLGGFDATHLSTTPVCLDSEYRSIVLYSDNDAYLAQIAEHSVSMVHSLCSFAGPPVSLLLFPLAHPKFGVILDAALNAIVSLLYTTWRISTQRCMLAEKQGKPTSLCAPDFAPFFRHVERMVEVLGIVFDAWLEAAFEFTLMLYVERKDTLTSDCGMLNILPQTLDVSSGHILALDNGLFATVRADSATFYADGKEPFTRKPTKTTFVDLRYGVVPIDFDATANERVAPGRGRTSVMGCRCIDDTEHGPIITCPVFTFDAQRTNAGDDAGEIRVLFADASPNATKGVFCDQLHISVQPLGADIALRDVGAQLTGGCMAGGRGCAFVDAAIYVMLECGSGVGIPKCIKDAQNNLCAPFCVGVRQMGAGLRPILLSNYATLFSSSGQLLLNMLCRPALQGNSQQRIIAYTGEQEETIPIEGYSNSDSYSQCDYTMYSSTISLKVEEVGEIFQNFAATIQQADLFQPILTAASSRINSLQGFGLDSLEDLPVRAEINDRAKFFRASRQPFVFAGQFLLYEDKTVAVPGNKDIRSVVLARLQLTTANSIILQNVMENIPFPGNLVPDESMSLLQQHNLGASMPRGVIFYAINPDLDGFSGLLMDNATTVTLASAGARLVRLDPIGQCLGSAQSSPQTTRWCGPNLIQNVSLFDDSWTLDADKFRNKRFDLNYKTDLYIDAVARYSDSHVLVTVRHGPLCALGIESQQGRLDSRIQKCAQSTTIKTYYVNATTMEISETVPSIEKAVRLHDAVLCELEHRLPPVFSVVSGIATVALRFLSVVINDVVINGIGIIQDIVTDNNACRGGSLMHSAYDYCTSIRPRPLSLLPVHFSIVDLHVSWRLAVERLMLLLHRLFSASDRQMQNFLLAAGLTVLGPDAEQTRTILSSTISRVIPVSLNLAAALPRIAGEAALLSAYYGTFIYEYYVLPLGTFLLKKITTKKFTADAMWRRAVATHYSVMTGGAFENKIMVPLERTCFIAAQLAYDPANPIGQMLFYGCRVSIESIRLSVEVVADVFVIPNIANCVCQAFDTNADPEEALRSACEDAIPDNVWHTYVGLVQDARLGYQMSKAVCNAERSNIRRRLFAAPSRLVNLVSSLGDALADTVAFLPSLTNLPGLQGRECARPERNIDGAVMIPQPLVSFMACGLTPTCRTKCAAEISWFEERRAREEANNATQVYRQKNPNTYLPVFGAQPGEPFLPLTAQAYVRPRSSWLYGDEPCMYDIVVVTRPIDRRDWSLRMYCMQTELADSMELVRIETLPGTAFWISSAEALSSEGKNNSLVEMLAMAPKLHDGDGTRKFGAVLYVQTYHTGTYSTHVHRFTASLGGTGVQHELLMTAANILPLMLSSQDARSLLHRTTGREDYYDGYSIDNPVETDTFSNQRLKYPVLFRASQQEQDLSVHYTARYTVKVRHPEYGLKILRLMIVARFHTDSSTPDIALRVIEEQRHLIPNLVQSSLVFSTLSGSALHVLQHMQLCEYKVVRADSIANLTLVLKENGCRAVTNGRRDVLWQRHGHHYASTVVTSPDGSSQNALRALRANIRQLSTSSGWLSEVTFEVGDNEVEMIVKSGVTTQLIVEYEESCTYLTCNACSNPDVKRTCQAAQNCAISECIGTKVHMKDVFCSFGLLLREIGEVEFKDFIVLWQGFVELLSTVLEGGQPLTKSGEIEIEALSNMLVTTMCETKDVVAVTSTILPTLVSTIAAAVNFKASTSGPVRTAYRKMNRLLAPAADLVEMQSVLAASQFLYQIALGFVQWMYVNARLLMCALRSFGMLTIGRNIFVDIDVNPEGDVCSLMLAGSSYNDQTVQERVSQLTSSARLTATGVNSVQDARAQSLVSPGTSMRVGVATSLASVFVLDSAAMARMKKNCKGKKCPSSKSLKKLPDRRILLFYITAAFDFITGILYGVAGIGKITQEEKCSLRPKIFSTALQCVCGDKPVLIAKSSETVEYDFWCRGILRMIDQDGRETFLWQQDRYSTLVEKYELAGKAYLNCITENGEESTICRNLLSKIEDVHKHSFGRVSPVAVMLRCRENFFMKQWDAGLFAAFDDETWNRTRLPEAARQDILTRVSGLTFTDAELCLKRGPTAQNIKQCTNSFFAQTDQTSIEDSRLGQYFRYEDVLTARFEKKTIEAEIARLGYPIAIDHTSSDACIFLSNSQAFGSLFDACDSANLEPRYREIDADQRTICNVSMSTRTLSSGRQENAVEVFVDNAKYTVKHEKYDDELEWIQKYLDDYSQILTVENLQKYTIKLHSFEGDLLHTMMDCMVQGPYNEFSFMPADPGGLAQNLSYQRPNNYSLCTQPEIMDTFKNERVMVQQGTCGSPTRIALINAYLQQKQTSIVEDLYALIQDKIKQLREDFSKRENFRTLCSGNDKTEDDCLPQYHLTPDKFTISMRTIMEQGFNIHSFLSSNIEVSCFQFYCVVGVFFSA